MLFAPLLRLGSYLVQQYIGLTVFEQYIAKDFGAALCV